jgi:UDP-N-acetylglucosamine 1-carboxyvinyltransferase
MPDRIEAGTFIAAVGLAGGEVEMEEFPFETLGAVIEKFEEAGLRIEKLDGNRVLVKKVDRLKGTDIITQPYPGFPTDMQAQFMAAMCLADGISVIKETIFENRFMHALELQRLGADISIEGNTVVVKGVEKLIGAKVTATDLRASASLVIAGLAAENTTEVYRIYHLDRGYEKMEKKLRLLGADIRREKSELPY